MKQGFSRSSGRVNSRQKTAWLRYDAAFLAHTAVINNVSRVLISNVPSARLCHIQLVICAFFVDKKKTKKTDQPNSTQNKVDTTYESNGCLIIKYIYQLMEIIDIIYN